MDGTAPLGALYKIVTGAEWRAAQRSGVLAWSAVDRRDGFMHLSTAAQVLETARRHFAGAPQPVALEIDAARIAAAVKFEPGRGGELFPHLYGDLSVDAVIRVRPLLVSAAGAYSFIEEDGA